MANKIAHRGSEDLHIKIYMDQLTHMNSPEIKRTHRSSSNIIKVHIQKNESRVYKKKFKLIISSTIND